MKCSQYRVSGIPPYFISLIFKKYMCQYNTVAECESKRGSTVSVLINWLQTPFFCLVETFAMVGSNWVTVGSEWQKLVMFDVGGKWQKLVMMA
jgi:hypothetical protein